MVNREGRKLSQRQLPGTLNREGREEREGGQEGNNVVSPLGGSRPDLPAQQTGRAAIAAELMP
jgi:hypothetical protein